MNVIIIGASARAAAFSAYRAGMQPWCVDLFADEDLRRRFPVRKVPLDAWPYGILSALADAPDAPVIYTGGLENYPELIARIDRPIWGNPPEVLRRVRSPYLLDDALREHGLPTLAIRADPPSAGDERRWLLKPLRGSGGIGIRHYRGREWFDPRTHYLQECGPGECLGLLFLGLPQGTARLLGFTRQFYVDWLHAPPFHYCGNMFPCTLAPWDLQRIGSLIARTFHVRGLFGVDVALRPDPSAVAQVYYVLEVNPRYTASVELLERACRQPLLNLHCAACEGMAVAWQPSVRVAPIGKAVLYARDKVVFPATGPWSSSFSMPTDAVAYADIPNAGDTVSRGRPVLSFFGSAASDGDCLGEFERMARDLDRCLWG